MREGAVQPDVICRRTLLMVKPTAIVVGVGAERGLGAALCRRFAAEGLHVLVAGRTAAKIHPVAQAIVASGGTAEAIATDATVEEEVLRVAVLHGSGMRRNDPNPDQD